MQGAEKMLDNAMIDGFGRRIDYLRISVTDRCDLRCRYCMSENMQFLPRKDVLTLEETAIIADRFINRGVRHIRLTGGEPLVRRDFSDLAHRIGRHLQTGALKELTLTTNGSRLAEHADALAASGIRRINVSLDSLNPETYAFVTRGGVIGKTLDGINAAQAAGIAVKINMVALRGVNDSEFNSMLEWCADQGHDLTLIETMPLGEIGEDRFDRYMPLHEAVAAIRERHDLTPLDYRTGGPARYFLAGKTGVRLGLITPLTENFCAGCNRMRLTCQGKIFMCLGHEDHIDLKAAFRENGAEAVDALLDRALAKKPERHSFAIGPGSTSGATQRHMNVTGG